MPKKLSEETKISALRLALQGKTNTQISKLVGISRSTVRKLREEFKSFPYATSTRHGNSLISDIVFVLTKIF
jgi:transposase-like protein